MTAINAIVTKATRKGWDMNGFRLFYTFDRHSRPPAWDRELIESQRPNVRVSWLGSGCEFTADKSSSRLQLAAGQGRTGQHPEPLGVPGT
jgi:hypothetical protein